MAVPLILWGAAAALAATGVKKGVDAKKDFDRAENIAQKARRRHRDTVSTLDSNREETNLSLKALGQIKADILLNQFKYLIDFQKRLQKSGSAKLQDFEEAISPIELKEMARLVEVGLDINKNMGTSAAGGVLAGLAAYGSVGVLASASTGTAIATLSGAAAQSATLAWLGGGSIAAGGFGVAGGTLALGGIVLGPALAIGGFMMASKAEEALTEARRYAAKIDEQIAEIEISITYLKGLRSHAAELAAVIESAVGRFEKVKTDDITNKAAIDMMFLMGKSLKQLIDLPLIDKNEKLIGNLKSTYSGLLIYSGNIEQEIPLDHHMMTTPCVQQAALHEEDISFPNDFRRDSISGDLHAAFDDKSKEELEALGKEVVVAGRIMTRRIMGKAAFVTLQDMGGQIQLYVSRDELPEGVYNEKFKKWDMGDIIGARGKLFKTQTGELTIHCSDVRLLQ